MGPLASPDDVAGAGAAVPASLGAWAVVVVEELLQPAKASVASKGRAPRRRQQETCGSETGKSESEIGMAVLKATDVSFRPMPKGERVTVEVNAVQGLNRNHTPCSQSADALVGSGSKYSVVGQNREVSRRCLPFGSEPDLWFRRKFSKN